MSMRVFPLCLTEEWAKCCGCGSLSPQSFDGCANRDLVRIGDDLDERGALMGESVLQRGSEIAALRNADAMRAERLGEEGEVYRAEGGRAHPAGELALLMHADR